MAGRSLHRRSLAEVPTRAVGPARTATLEDAEGLSRLMLDAYVGTIDYEGETIAEAREAIGEYLEDRPLLDCSFVLEHRGDLIAAVLASLWSDEQPLISYAITAGPHKRTGSAVSLLGHVLTALGAAGYGHVHAVITNGNVASEGLFRAAGFAVVDHPPSGN